MLEETLIETVASGDFGDRPYYGSLRDIYIVRYRILADY